MLSTNAPTLTTEPPIPPPIRHYHTTDLVNELLSRYDEAIFIGTTPTTHANSADTHYDVMSKLRDRTSMNGVLARVLRNLLTKLGGT